MALTSFRAAGGNGDHLQPGGWKEERTGGRLGGWNKELVLPSSSAWGLPGLSHPLGALGLHPPSLGSQIPILSGLENEKALTGQLT